MYDAFQSKKYDLEFGNMLNISELIKNEKIKKLVIIGHFGGNEIILMDKQLRQRFSIMNY